MSMSWSEAGQTYEVLLILFAARSVSLTCIIPTARAIPVSAMGVPYLVVSSMQSELILVFSKTDSKAFSGGMKSWC